MRLVALAPIVAIGLLVLSSMPAGAASAPVRGTVTSCASNWDCKFAFNTSAGTGWAHGAGVSYYTSGLFSFQLPGEALASYNLTYSTYIQSLTGTYTYWTVGNFLGTDVNTGKVVFGQTNTNYTITCHGHSGVGGGCTYTYTTDNGTVIVKFTNKTLTGTVVTCASTSVHVGGKTTCTATVTNLWNSSNVPVGKVKFSAGGGGWFSNSGVCYLTGGSCTLTFHMADNACGAVTILANYAGTAAFYKSQSTVSVTAVGGC